MPEIVNTTPLAIKSSFDEANDNRPIMVDVDHVSMIFNMASEQLNSIKEYMIALAKRELMFKEFRALDDVSFTVRKGDVFGILGTNGSGKSTVLKVIAGVLEPSKGTCDSACREQLRQRCCLELYRPSLEAADIPVTLQMKLQARTMKSNLLAQGQRYQLARWLLISSISRLSCICHLRKRS